MRGSHEYQGRYIRQLTGCVGSANTFQPTQQATFFDTVKGDLASPLFAARLRHGAPGYYNFGSIDGKA